VYFQSKRDVNYNLIIWLQVLIICILPWINISIVTDNLLIYLPITGLYLILLLWIWFGTGYEIKENYLLVRSGPFRKKIAISEIKEVELHSNGEDLAIVIGPALSFTRINIIYSDSFDLISISPKNRENFIHELSLRNRDIKIP